MQNVIFLNLNVRSTESIYFSVGILEFILRPWIIHMCIHTHTHMSMVLVGVMSLVLCKFGAVPIRVRVL